MVSKVEPEGQEKDASRKKRSSQKEDSQESSTSAQEPLKQQGQGQDQPPEGGRNPCQVFKLRIIIFIIAIGSIIFYLVLITIAIFILALTLDKSDFGGGGGSDPGWRKGALDAHNALRAKHCVPNLVLSDDLNKNAQQCAEHLAKNNKFEHSCGKDLVKENYNPKNLPYGENLMGGGLNSNKEQAAKDSANGWYKNEEPNYNYEDHVCEIGKVCGHFTQVVWKDSKELGVGYAANGDSKVVVAQYHPPGNYPWKTAHKENVFPAF